MLFDQIWGQVERLIPVFGVSRQASDVLASFEALCAESLDIDIRHCAPELSRINADGTPFQFCLSLNPDRPAALQFLGEAGRPGASMEERRRAGFTCLERLARACEVVEEVERITPILSELAPQHPDLLADASGIFWFALSFSPDAPPSLTVYVNGQWGPEAARWQRVDRIAACFDSATEWHRVKSVAPPGLSPLGFALTVRPKRAPTGRIYLRAFGEPLRAYHRLFLACDATREAAEAVDEFGQHMLRDDVIYPTRSAVFSLELPARATIGAKLEFCAHCAFAHDAEAAARISSWLRQLGVNEQPYHAVVSTLSLGRPLSDCALPSLHAYVGIGTHGSHHYGSIYLNPGPALGQA